MLNGDISWVLISFSVFGSYLGMLLSLGQYVLARRTALNRLLILLFLSLSALQISILLFTLDGYQTYPRLTLLHLPILGSLGPVLFGIHRLIQNAKFENSLFGLSWHHALMPGFFFFAYAVLCLLPSGLLSEKIYAFKSRSGFSRLDFFYVAPYLTIMAYIGVLIVQSRGLFRITVLRDEWSARVLLYLVVATSVNHSIGVFFLVGREAVFFLIGSFMMTISLCVTYLIGRKYPAYFQNLQQVSDITRLRYSRSLLQGEDLEALRVNLIQTMERDRLYEDESLTLSMLADELALSPHQLSEFINQNLGKNFSAFINEYRVKESCRLLTEEPDKSVLTIALEVGFRSKTSFNRAFLRQMGVKPSEYRHTHRQSASL